MTVGRIPSIEGGIQPTLLDAKGDLISATAADTPARLAVGTNEHRLVAASGETTGLKYVADTTNYAVGAKGDLLAGTAADTIAALAVGANGTVLTADSVETTGLKWVTPASGGMTLLSTTTLSGASTTISSIDQTHKDLIILISGMVVSSTGLVTVRLNNASNQNSIAAEKNAGGAPVLTHRIDYIPLNPTTINSSPNNAWQIHISNYADTSYRKPFRMSGGYLDGTDFSAQNIGGMNNSISAITSFVVNASTGTFSAGQVLVYGVK